MKWQLAELNIARLRSPLEDPATLQFVKALDEINALGESGGRRAVGHRLHFPIGRRSAWASRHPHRT